VGAGLQQRLLAAQQLMLQVCAIDVLLLCR
jgi:hypothetical protein